MGLSKHNHMRLVVEAGADATLVRAAQSTTNVKSLRVSRWRGSGRQGGSKKGTGSVKNTPKALANFSPGFEEPWV